MKYERCSDKSFTENFLPQARDRAASWKDTETFLVARGERPWPYYNRPISELDKKASSVLKKTFSDFLTERRAQNGKVTVLDIMGTGGFVDEYSVDTEIAVTLVDHRSEEQKEADLRRGKEVIGGDVMDDALWEEVKSKGPFDLVTCRPLGGWKVVKSQIYSTKPDALQAEVFVVDNMVATLAPDGGTLVVEMSGATPYDEWTKELQKVPGIDASCSSNTDPLKRFHSAEDANIVRITRTDEVYGELPFLPQNSKNK